MLALILISISAVVLCALGGTVLLVLYPLLPADLGGAPNLDHRSRRLRIPVDGDDWIDGWHLRGRRPGVIMVLHGYGRTHCRAWRYGDFLQRSGYHVLTFDFRSSRYRSRKPTTLGHFELRDAEAALAWIRSQPELAGHAIGVLGESLGGTVALLLAGAHPEIAAVVADGAFATGLSAIEDSCERWARLPRQPSADILRSLGRAVTGCDPGTVDALAAARGLTRRPLLFIHGTEDNRLSEQQVRRLWRAAGSKDPLWVLPGVGHNQGWLRHRPRYERLVQAFFDHHLLASGVGLPAGEL